jgi:serine/threonine protein kinase/Tol biopolymer transport system component
MDERWQQIERRYHAARELDGRARAEFLAKECAGDDDLRREVESLLVQADQHESFLKSPAIEVAAGNLTKDTNLGNTTGPVLEPGTMIAHYRLAGKIGEGGMGEVYRARDTKLQRDVALKILPQAMVHDAERMARFEREAQVLASLNHPNIAAIHGLEESDGIRALVMELVEGETLAERLRGAQPATREPSPQGRGWTPGAGPGEGSRGPSLGIDETLPIARQIAEALEYAHERGVIHRDLKPANVKITPEGTVKVLDFGLAKVLNPQDSTSVLDPANSPSLTSLATRPGMLLGTAAYMSPEQAKGQRVDRRCDIWAFGCVLYEMLTGRKAFAGETITEVLAAVIRAEPDWDAIPDTTPTSIQRLIRRCLIKDPKQRLRDIGEARITIEEMISGTGVPPVDVHGQDARTSDRRSSLRRFLPWVLAGSVSVALIAVVVLWRLATPAPQHLVRFSVEPPENTTLPVRAGMSLSPDGRTLAFAAQPAKDKQRFLWLRPLDALTAQQIPGTEGAYAPFWSPDGNYLGFYARGNLEKVAISGGTPQTLCKAGGNGATWSKSGVIVFASHGRLYRVPETGGTRTPVDTPDRAGHEQGYRLPQFLPDGRHFLFLIDSGLDSPSNRFSIGIGSLDSKKVERLSATSSNAVYALPGYLLYMVQTRLMARPFNAAGLKFTGQAVSIAEGVGLSAWGHGQFAVSQTGAVAYRTGGSANLSQMVWVNRKGEKLETVGQPGVYTSPALSPDGNKLAIERGELGKTDLWIYDLKHGTASRLTFNSAADVNPVWSADGKRIFFTSSRRGQNDIYQKAANGLGSTQALYVSRQRFKDLDDLSRDGRYGIYDTGPTGELWVLPLFGKKIPSAYIQGKFGANQAQISPNGRYVGYTSNETGKAEVYVQTFPQHTGKWRISTAGGSEPMWRGDGKELFYLGPGDGLMAVEVNTAAGQFQAGTPKLLFKAHMVPEGIWRNIYAVSPDGQRFLLLEPATGGKSSPITVVLNWPALLKNAAK